jgi:tRNA dimethylallyltransferase
MQKTLISVSGATAIGKTAFAIALAQKLQTEIISCDSRQFYKEMTIGTAKPSEEELQKIPHHFINNISVKQSYSVGQFERETLQLLKNLFENQNIVIMVGGSGLYEKAIIEGLDDFPETTIETRNYLNQLFLNEGIESLQKLLKEKDEDYFNEVDIYNSQRVIRALEVCIDSRKPFSSFRKKSTQQRFFNVIRLGLQAPREIIYERINNRVKKMFEQGLLKEAQSLYEFKECNALQTVGYQEIFQHLEGKFSLEETQEEIKKNTRRFAKRQQTWYKKQPNIHWIEYDKTDEFIANFKVQ